MREWVLWVLWIVGSIIAFNVFVIMAFKSGTVSRTRDEYGAIRKIKSKKSVLMISAVMAFFVLCVCLFDYSLFRFYVPGFWRVFVSNFIMVMVVVLYDSLVIDLWVIGKVRPRFLNLPETMDMKAMKSHVKRQFTVGWIFVLPIVILPTLIYIIWLK